LLTPDVKDAEDPQEQWWWLRRRLRRPPPRPAAPTVRELYQAYEEATGTVLGCD
jgi:hypothetical protein